MQIGYDNEEEAALQHTVRQQQQHDFPLPKDNTEQALVKRSSEPLVVEI